MARLTVEDCLPYVTNRFDLVLKATNRARKLEKGAEAFVAWDNDKATVVALREIAQGLLKESIESEAESIESKAESIESEAESIESKAESIESKAESIELEAESIESEAESIESPAQSIEENTTSSGEI